MITDQLKEYCDCVEFDDKDIFDMIAVVSLATGWTRFPCETFETSERREVINLPTCMDCPYTFEPYYHPFDPESFTFQLLEINELEETVTDLDFHYSPYTESFKVNLGLPTCDCICGQSKNCGCPSEYKLLVNYTAGYDELPDCVLPVLCNLLEVIHAKNSCDCEDCCDSGTSKYDADGNVTTQEIKYKTGDFVSVFLETDLGKMLVKQYKSQLALLSLIIEDADVWGFVV